MSNFGDMLQEYYVRRFRDLAAQRQKRLAALRSADDAQSYIAAVRARIRRAYSFPQTPSPLSPRVTRVIAQDGFRIENTIIHSRPGFPITCNVYLPEHCPPPWPAVLELCGHAPDGKAFQDYQAVAISLCLSGCVVLVPDPIGQGERTQYPEDDAIFNCAEHNLLNRRLLLTGDCFGAWRLHDAITCVDALLARPEVDKARVGVTGNSGGGTMTTLLNALDDRLAAAAPNCFITRWLSNIENELPADAEQIPFGVAADGGDLADYLIAAAPRPLLITAEQNDFFDLRGTRDVFAELKHFYALLGCPERVQLQVGDDVRNHAFHQPAREATYAFFQRQFGLPTNSSEPAGLTAQTRQNLNCTPTGQVTDLPGTTTVHDVIANRVQDLVRRQPDLPQNELRQALCRKLGLPEVVAAPHYRQLRPFAAGAGRLFARYGLETEDGILVTMVQALDAPTTAHFHLPASPHTELYIAHLDSKAELKDRVLQQGTRVYGLDVRGVGESRPNGCDQQPNPDFFAFYHTDYHYDSLSLLLGESFLGGRVRDILAAVALLAAHGNENITLTASGIGCYPALLAAFLGAGQVTLRLPEDFTSTYAQEALSRRGDCPQSMMLPGILTLTDLDKLRALLP